MVLTFSFVKKSVAEGRSVTAVLEGSCTVKVVDNGKNFADTADHWAKASISFVTAHELFQGTGLINGKAGGRLDPAGNATRAEVAVILERMVRLIAG